PAGGQIWWIGCWGLVVAATTVRLLLDMRQCRSALLVTVFALALWCVALSFQLSVLQVPGISIRLVAGTLKLTRDLMLVLGLTLYARYVVLHAQGLLPARNQRPRKERSKKETKSATSAQPVVVAKLDGPHHASSTANRPHAAGSAPAAPHASFAASTGD